MGGGGLSLKASIILSGGCGIPAILGIHKIHTKEKVLGKKTPEMYLALIIDILIIALSVQGLVLEFI